MGTTSRREEPPIFARQEAGIAVRRAFCAAFTALMITSNPAVAQVIDAEEHRRPAQAPRVLAPPGTRTFVVALGTGHPAPNPNRFGPATAIVVDRTSYLFDAGEGVWRAAAHGGRIAEALDLTKKPTRVFLTHLHSDHTVGLPSLMLAPWTYGREDPLQVYGPPGTKDLVANLLEAYRLDIENRVGRSTNALVGDPLLTTSRQRGLYMRTTRSASMRFGPNMPTGSTLMRTDSRLPTGSSSWAATAVPPRGSSRLCRGRMSGFRRS